MVQTESEQRELKLIGMRVDEALSELIPFIDHAHAAGLSPYLTPTKKYHVITTSWSEKKHPVALHLVF